MNAGGDLQTGATIQGRFTLDQFLGEGGMGAVWAAHHVLTGKPVALKILKGVGEEQRRRFVQEARVAAAIRHPNVVDIHDVIELADGRPALVMDLLDGEPLDVALERKGKFELIELMGIVLSVLAGLGAAHAEGIVHRDMKPENIFLCVGPTGEHSVKLLDFGIAKLTALASAIRHTSALTQTGSVLGTPMYMAPEQVFGEKGIDHRADFWSLGIVIYECLTGECPIQGDNVGQLFKSISQRDFPPIAKKLPELPPGIAELIDSMLSIKPEDRPDSAREIAQAFAFHTGLSLPAIAEPRWLPGSRRRVARPADPMAATEEHQPARRPLRRLGIAALAAAGVSLLAAVTWRLTAAPVSAEPAPVISATASSQPLAAPAPSASAPSSAPPPTTQAELTTPPTAVPSAPPSGSSARPLARTSTSAVASNSAAPVNPKQGPGGIEVVSPY